MAKNSRVTRNTKIVVIGLGYVGLAMATLCSSVKRNGKNIYQVYGLEKKNDKGKQIINSLNKKKLPFKVEDKTFNKILKESICKGNFKFGFDENEIKNASIVILSINFDVDIKKVKVNFKNIIEIISLVSNKINENALIFIETTLPPGTSELILFPEIKKIFLKRNISTDNINLAYSFERVTPGANYLNSIKEMHRVYAANNKYAEKITETLLKNIINVKKSKISKLNSLTEVELCKVVENSYRAVNIAFIEEWRNYASGLGINLNQILDYIRLRKTHNNIMKTGIGVGGYCLTKDPLLGLISDKEIFKKNYKFPLSTVSLRINLNMTLNIMKEINKKFNLSRLKSKKIYLFGASYREGVGDTRFSPSSVIYDYLKKINKENIKVIDPYLDYWSEKNILIQKLFNYKDVDIAIFIVGHKKFKNLKLDFKKSCIIIDTNNIFSKKKINQIKKNYKNNYFVGNYLTS